RPTERPVTRGTHHDVFEERTPPPAATRAPAGPVIGRLTKNVAGPAKTALGMPAVAPPPTPAAARTTAPRAPVQRPPAVPPAAPPAATMTREPETRSAGSASTVIVDPTMDDSDSGFSSIATDTGVLDLDELLPPGSTAKGFAPPPALTAPSLD